MSPLHLSKTFFLSNDRSFALFFSFSYLFDPLLNFSFFSLYIRKKAAKIPEKEKKKEWERCNVFVVDFCGPFFLLFFHSFLSSWQSLVPVKGKLRRKSISQNFFVGRSVRKLALRNYSLNFLKKFSSTVGWIITRFELYARLKIAFAMLN